MKKCIRNNHKDLSILSFPNLFECFKRPFMALNRLLVPCFTHLCKLYCISTTKISLLCKFTSSSIVYLLVYVNDIIITSSNDIEVKQLMSMLHNLFALKYLGYLNYFLGIESISFTMMIPCLDKESTLENCWLKHIWIRPNPLLIPWLLLLLYLKV